jgi:hypothetical protein
VTAKVSTTLAEHRSNAADPENAVLPMLEAARLRILQWGHNERPRSSNTPQNVQQTDAVELRLDLQPSKRPSCCT